MLKPRKRLTKRKMKEDKLVTSYFKAIDYVNQNAKLIGGIGVGIVLLIMGSFLYTRSKRDAEMKASVELAKVQLEYSKQQYKTSIDILKSLVENYSGTPSAGMGVFYLANTYFSERDFDNARKYYQKYLDDYGGDDILSSSSLSGIAACLEEKGQFEEAAQYYEKAAQKYSRLFQAPEQLMNAARCYVLADRKQKAQQIYKQVIENYPDSGLRNDAELYLAKLMG